MKIAPKAVDSFLSAPQKEHSAVLIYGVDGGLVRERTGKVIKAVLGEMASNTFAKTELNETEITSDPARLADELSSVSMMCSKRVIIIRDAGDKLTKTIEAAASFFNKDNFLIIMADELSARSSLRAFFEKSANCAAIACYKDEIRDIQAIIRNKLTQAGISYENGVIDYLSGQLGNDRYVTYQELEKLITYAGDEKKLSLKDAELLVDYNQDTQLDALINSVCDKNLAALEKNLSLHIRENTQPILYLRSLQRYFNRLYSIRIQMHENSQTAAMVVSGLRPPVHFKQKDHLIRHASNWNIENIVKALNILISAELDCKTSDLPSTAASSRKLMKLTQIR